jgi:hypothetical protein
LAATLDYKMDVTMDVKNYQYKGKQEILIIHLIHLRKVYYHLFNNAFQPGSEMDARHTASKILTEEW